MNILSKTRIRWPDYHLPYLVAVDFDGPAHARALLNDIKLIVVLCFKKNLNFFIFLFQINVFLYF
jgi:hypothetical protein